MGEEIRPAAKSSLCHVLSYAVFEDIQESAPLTSINTRHRNACNFPVLHPPFSGRLGCRTRQLPSPIIIALSQSPIPAEP